MRKNPSVLVAVTAAAAAARASTPPPTSWPRDRGTGLVRTRQQPKKAQALEGSSSPSPQPAGFWIVVELGSEWPLLVEETGAVRRVTAQREGESPAAFAERAADTLEGLFGRGVKLTTVALSCNERVDDAADGARRKVAGLALGAMAKQKSGRVLLTAAPRSNGRLRHALSSLAQGLSAEWRTAGLEVSVDFGDGQQATSATGPLARAARVA